MTDLALGAIEATFRSDDAPARECAPSQGQRNISSRFEERSPVIELAGQPTVTINLPDSPQTEWIRHVVYEFRTRIQSLIQEVFGSLGVDHIETHGPGMRLPTEYKTPVIRGMLGYVGVTATMQDGSTQRTYVEYSTLGGSPLLSQSNPHSAINIIEVVIKKMEILLKHP